MQALIGGASASAGVPAAGSQEVEHLRARVDDLERLLRDRISLVDSLPGEVRLAQPPVEVEAAGTSRA